MTKKISREIITETVLEMIKKKEGIKFINFREIAGVIGCAHTNLYNYFSSFEEILWSAVDEVNVRMIKAVTYNIEAESEKKKKLKKFFENFLEFYLNNKGWFRLIWFEPIGSKRPEKSLIKGEELIGKLILSVKDVYEGDLTEEESKKILHNVHCYLHGEVSIFISGRGLRKEEEEFKRYVVEECVNMTNLMVKDIKNQ